MNNVKKIRHSTSTSPKRTDEDVEPIRLSKYSGGYQPDPNQPAKIESLDWPSPPYPAAVPELRSRSRSSSNRKLASSSMNKSDCVDANLIDDESAVNDVPYKIHYKNKVYDDDYNDYTLKFRNYKHGSYSAVTNDSDVEFENLVKKETSLKRDLEELNKLETKSGMAKLFGIELKVWRLVLVILLHFFNLINHLLIFHRPKKD
jgi:hypothetical protein